MNYEDYYGIVLNTKTYNTDEMSYRMSLHFTADRSPFTAEDCLNIYFTSFAKSKLIAFLKDNGEPICLKNKV